MVWLRHRKGSVALHCVASKHCFDYKYEWDNIDGRVGVDSPVLYVNKVGTYRCKVTNMIDSAQCRSASVSVYEGMIVLC